MVNGRVRGLAEPKLRTQRVGELQVPTQRPNPQAVHRFMQLGEERFALLVCHAARKAYDFDALDRRLHKRHRDVGRQQRSTSNCVLQGTPLKASKEVVGE